MTEDVLAAETPLRGSRAEQWPAPIRVETVPPLRLDIHTSSKVDQVTVLDEAAQVRVVETSRAGRGAGDEAVLVGTEEGMPQVHELHGRRCERSFTAVGGPSGEGGVASPDVDAPWPCGPASSRSCNAV